MAVEPLRHRPGRSPDRRPERPRGVARLTVIARRPVPPAQDPPAVPSRRHRRDLTTTLAAAVLVACTLLALAADLLATHLFGVGPTTQNLRAAYGRPDFWTPALWLGADELGRSQIVRLLYAARLSLAVGFGAAALNVLLGVSLGLAAGYWRGRVDDLVLWLVSTMRAVPSLFLLLAVATVFESGAWTLVIILGLLSWQGTALFVRGQVFSLRQREFVSAARAVGASDGRIMLRHVLPNVLPLVVTLAAIDVGSVILAESALSFLGLGIMPPTPSWGNMLMNAAGQMATAPWLVIGPGVMILVTVLSLYLLGDGVRDALDPLRRPS